MHTRNGPICMRISVAMDPNSSGPSRTQAPTQTYFNHQQQQQQRRKVPTLECPACRVYDVRVNELIGDVLCVWCYLLDACLINNIPSIPSDWDASGQHQHRVVHHQLLWGPSRHSNGNCWSEIRWRCWHHHQRQWRRTNNSGVGGNVAQMHHWCRAEFQPRRIALPGHGDVGTGLTFPYIKDCSHPKIPGFTRSTQCGIP